jgi:hypothetical protein
LKLYLTLVRVDFNIMRRQEDKNKDNFNAHWPFFNAIIESLDLREIELSGRKLRGRVAENHLHMKN